MAGDVEDATQSQLQKLQQDPSGACLGPDSANLLKELKKRKAIDKRYAPQRMLNSDSSLTPASMPPVSLLDSSVTVYKVSKGPAFTTTLKKGEAGACWGSPLVLQSQSAVIVACAMLVRFDGGNDCGWLLAHQGL